MSGDNNLLRLLYRIDSLYNLDNENMQKWVVDEERKLMEQTEMLRLAPQKLKEAEDLKRKAGEKKN